MGHPLRTRFAHDIVTEFLPPKKDTKEQNVVIFCTGMPSSPSKSKLLKFWSEKNYWAFHPRYRGSWESDGEFLEQSPHLDILDVLDGLYTQFSSIESQPKTFSLQPDNIFIIGCSFGGPAAILCSKDPRITKILAISPVIDWSVEGPDEPFEWFGDYVKQAFGQAYRFPKQNWKRLREEKFYSPINNINEIDGSKIMIMHAYDDRVIPIETILKFQELTNCNLHTSKKGGHFSTNRSKHWRHFRTIRKFFHSK